MARNFTRDSTSNMARNLTRNSTSNMARNSTRNSTSNSTSNSTRDSTGRLRLTNRYETLYTYLWNSGTNSALLVICLRSPVVRNEQ